MSQAFDAEVGKGRRFRFGRNWSRFLASLDEGRLAAATSSLREMLGRSSLEGVRFLDLGSGSGLFSLAARRLGAEVVSVDYDPESVRCALELRKRFAEEPGGWRIEQGSALDAAFLESLGLFDVTYSWGVLHHTGSLWEAIDNAAATVAPGGELFIAIYNDQGWQSRAWLAVKRLYNALPDLLQPLFVGIVLLPFEAVAFLRHLLSLSIGTYLRSWRVGGSPRGMNRWHDWVDWVGGLPFEVASVEAIVGHCRRRDFEPVRIKDVGRRLGCNEFIFRRGA